MNAITGTATAWLTSGSHPRDLRDAGAAVISRVTYSQPDSDMSEYGWIRVGTARIELDLLAEPQVVGNAIDMLRKKQTDIAAKAEAARTQIEAAIQNLLAIGFDAPTVYVADPSEEDIPF